MTKLKQLKSSKFRGAFLALAASLILGIAGQLLMKDAATSSVASSAISHLNIGKTLLALFIYGLGVLFWIVALRSVRLSIAYPVSSLNYVGIFLGSYYLFGEEINAQRLIGVGLIFLGVLLVVLHGKPNVVGSAGN